MPYWYTKRRTEKRRQKYITPSKNTAKNFPGGGKETEIPTHEVHWTPDKMNSSKSTTKYILSQLSKTKGTKKILKAAKKWLVT